MSDDHEIDKILNSDKPYIINGEGTIPVIEVNLEGKNGLRVIWDGSPSKCKIEMKFEKDGEWIPISCVQNIEIALSVDELPIVKIKQLIFSKSTIKFI